MKHGSMRRFVAFSAVFFPGATAAVWASSPAGSPDLAAGIVRTAASPTAKTPSSTTTKMPVPAEEAPTGFDGQTIDENFVTQDRHDTIDRVEFEQVEQISPDGLGPIFNNTSCVACHQDPVTGAASQVSERRVGHIDQTTGLFANPQIPIDDGKAVIAGRSLVNDRSICPNTDFPNDSVQETVPASENIQTLRMSLSLLGDGFVEALADQTLLDLSKSQCTRTNGQVCGQAIQVPITEAPGQTAVGKFGWKDQHASLLSFAADAYLNEMGITNRLLPTEFTTICNPAKIPEPNSSVATESADDKAKRGGLEDIDLFARFIRATKAPAPDVQASGTAQVQRGEGLFTQVGCAMCHTPTLTTAAAGTKINGGQFTIPDALGNKTFHPFGDFLLHDVGTGDGIVQTPTEPKTQFKMRTAPLWGVRFRVRLMHDGVSSTLGDAILRHGGEAEGVKTQFQQLSDADQAALLAFLNSL
jgi:CxxC motif-containing protein (DUF1111 family)